MMQFGACGWLAALACWSIQAIAADASPSIATNAIAATAFEGESASIALLEARSQVSTHIAFAVAAGYLDAANGYGEGQLRLMAIGSWHRQRWSVDNRHTLSFSTGSVERYRVRARIARSELFGLSALSARAFDELFFDIDRERLIRNNVAVGFGLQLNQALIAEVYRVWEGNRGTPKDRYILGLVTVRF